MSLLQFRVGLLTAVSGVCGCTQVRKIISPIATPDYIVLTPALPKVRTVDAHSSLTHTTFIHTLSLFLPSRMARSMESAKHDPWCVDSCVVTVTDQTVCVPMDLFFFSFQQTRSGKIMRRVLRKVACRETSPEQLGDVSYAFPHLDE